MRKAITIITLILLCQTLLAQTNVEFKKQKFSSRIPAFKEAKRNLKKGDKFFDMGDGYFGYALPYYLKANIFNADNGFLNYKIGICYLKTTEKDKAFRYFTKAQKLIFNVAPDIHFRLGEAYQVINKNDEAIEEYTKYKGTLTPEEFAKQDKKIQRKIKECKVAKDLIRDSIRAFIDNLGPSINSAYPDYAAIISTDESVMYFTSKRAGSVGGKVDKSNEYDEDIYVSYREKNGWSKAVNAGKPLNSKSNDATIGLSPDGQQMYIYKANNGGDIFTSQKKGVEWRKVKPLSNRINTPFHESAASFSYDNNTIYFCSNSTKLENYGNHDIYCCKKDKKGKWGKPQNLGPVVNSEYDEVDVFMHPDGKTLYFSSNGHNTMGGYDIFKTVMKSDGTWSEPVNIGYPINTPLDERFFVMAGNGKHGFYSSARIGGLGSYDIYSVTFLGPEKRMFQSNEDNLIASIANPIKEKIAVEGTVEIKTSRLTVVKGTVYDGTTPELAPLSADIEITDNATNEIISTNKTNEATGKFLITLPSGKDYAVTAKKEGYLFHSENFNIPQTSAYQEKVLDIKLMKIQKDAKIVLRNVFFDFGKSTLKPESFGELDRLIDILTENPKLKIEIGGHTDNKGTKQKNMELSEARAKAVVDYLSKKIDTSRMTFKGYAFDVPVATNETEEGRALNRRVEFKIISNE